MGSTRLTYVCDSIPAILWSITNVYGLIAKEKSVSQATSSTTSKCPRPYTLECDLTTLAYRYNTRSNKVRVIKTPGGKLRYLYIKKKGSPPKCGDCGIKLPGVCTPPALEVNGERLKVLFYWREIHLLYCRWAALDLIKIEYLWGPHQHLAGAYSKKVESTVCATYADTIHHTDPRPTTSRILPNLETQKDRPTSIWWIEMFKLRKRQSRTSILDWGAEDREEGAQRIATEEAIDMGNMLCINTWWIRKATFYMTMKSAMSDRIMPWSFS